MRPRLTWMCLRRTCTSRSACTDLIPMGICGRVKKSRQVWARLADWSLADFEGWEGGSCKWLGEAVAGVHGFGMCNERGSGGVLMAGFMGSIGGLCGGRGVVVVGERTAK